MKPTVLLAAAAALCLCPAMAAAQSWTGPYVGGDITHASGESSADVTLGGQWTSESVALRNGVTALWSDEREPEGTGVSLFAGYNHEMASGIVVGAEIGYSFLDAEDSRLTPQTAPDPGSPGLTYSFGNGAEVNSTVNLRARLGYDFDPVMAYVIVGYSWADTTFSAEVLSNGGYSKAGETSENLGGVTWGLGAAWRLSPAWSVRAEYTRTDYDDVDFLTGYRPGSTFTTPPYTESFSQDLSVDTLSLGIGWHF